MVKTNVKKRADKKDLAFYIGLMLWPTLQFAVFYIFVNFNSLMLSFHRNAQVVGENANASVYSFLYLFQNIKLFITNVGVQKLSYSVRLSALSWLISTGVGVPLGLFFSYYIGKKMPAAGAFRVILFLPSIIPGIVLVAMYKYFMDQAMPMMLKDFFNVVKDSAPLDNSTTGAYAYILIFRIWISFGASVLMFSNSISGISPEIVEASQIDGANALQEFWHVSLPGVYPTLTVFLITGVACILTDQNEIFSFYGWQSGEISTVGYLLFVKTTAANGNTIEYPPIASFGILLTVIAVPVTFFVKHLLEKYGPSED